MERLRPRRGDLLKVAAVASAANLGFLAVKRLQMLAPRLIQAYARAGFAELEARPALAFGF